MTTENPGQGVCEDIAAVRYADEIMTFNKMKDRSDYTAFITWARNEARKLCEHGKCPKGHCQGRVDVHDWEVTDDRQGSFTCKFSAELFCRCG